MTDDEAESESQSLLTPNPSSFATTIKTHTDLFTTFITKETGKITASYQAKLDLLEAQLKASQEEVSLVKSLRNRDALYYSNLPRLEDLQEQLKASRKEVKAREEENERLCAFMRESNSKSQQEATEQRRKREGIEAELDRLHGEYQWLQRDRLDARTTAESLKRTLADTERSLADQKSLETSLRSSISETNNAHASLAREFAALTESSSKERKCLVDGMKKTETEFTMRLEATMRQSAEHEAKAKEVSAKLETSTGQVRLLVQEIDRLKRESRESTSVITGLQHKVDSSRQEVAYIQDQLTSLRTLHSQTLSDSTQKVERYAQLTVELRDKLSRIMSESESERASTEKQVLRMKHELSSAKTQWKVAEEYARGAERQMDDLFRQLSAAQVEGSRVKESFGKRISSLGDALRHHHLALLVDVDGSDMLLKPTPKLVVLGEKLHQLISNSGCTTLSQIPDKLTQHTEPVIPYLSSLVDQLIWIYNETSANSALAIASSNSDYGLTWKPQDQLLLSSAITDTSAAATVNTNNSATDSRSTPTKFINLTDSTSTTTAVFLNSPSGANIRANSYLSIHQTPISPKSTVAMTLVSKAATAEAGSSTETQTQTQTLLLPRRSLEDLVHPVNVDVTRRILSREAQDTDPSISEGASGRLRETREDVSISTKGASERLNEASEASEPASISTRGTSERSREARDESQCSFVHPDSSLSTEEVHLQESPQAPISTRGVKRAREVRGGVKLDNKIKRPRTSISRQECFAPSSSTTGPSISGDTNSDSAHRPPAPSPAPTGSESTADPSRSAATSSTVAIPSKDHLHPLLRDSNDPEQGPPAPTRPSPAPTAGPSNIATASISINENPELINQISTESPSSAVDGTTIPPKRKRGRPRKSNITKSKRTAMAPGSVPPDVLALTEEMERSRELQTMFNLTPIPNKDRLLILFLLLRVLRVRFLSPATTSSKDLSTPTLADPSSSSAAGPGSTDTFLASESQHKPSLTMSLVQASNIDDFELTNQDSTETVNKTTAGPSTDTSSSSDSLPPDASISTARMKRSREVREDVTPDANAKRSRTLPSVATDNDDEQGALGPFLLMKVRV
ncbi:hypothetical protein BT96DRAFT_52361 [Gymnopus androsaceus JB14]|uniref:Uncharacterized protein n=1 Tax=Gymnopus androsaceus JB14 TaxID=1447944 RepID=A0A6A4IF04_9AGAR|nr:hypothetical protein BT96DRAFT_52361 [Gymnopus androsaceus JB14]